MEQYIYTCNIMDLCLEEEKLLGEQLLKKWWDKEMLNLTNTRVDTEVGGTGEAEGYGWDDKEKK